MTDTKNEQDKEQQPSTVRKSDLKGKKGFPTAKTAEQFRTMPLPKKEVLIEGILHRRDLVAFAGRRRNGKTSVLIQLALSLTIKGASKFVGYGIPERRRVLLYLLEDDSREVQDRLNRMLEIMRDAGDTEGRLLIRTKDDFYTNDVPMGITEDEFTKMIEEDCKIHQPDLIIFDNLGFLVAADYTEAKTIHKYIAFKIYLSQKYNSAIITAAHPRKLGSNSREPASLAKDRDMFFEEVMGSSHFVNSCGSLWGIERTRESHSRLYVGSQRLSGDSQLMAVEMDDDGWFCIADDFEVNFKLVVHTSQRIAVWDALPNTFTYSEAREATKLKMKSKGAFTPLWNALKRVGLIVPVGEGNGEEEKRFKKAIPASERSSSRKEEGGEKGKQEGKNGPEQEQKKAGDLDGPSNSSGSLEMIQ